MKNFGIKFETKILVKILVKNLKLKFWYKFETNIWLKNKCKFWSIFAKKILLTLSIEKF